MTDDERFFAAMKERIENQDYEAIFAFGECYRFARRLVERKIAVGIRGIETPNHVWAKLKDGRGVDIRGPHREGLLAQFAGGYEGSRPVGDNDLTWCKNLAARRYPEGFEDRLNALADWVFDTHERFSDARPPIGATLGEASNAPEQQPNPFWPPSGCRL